LQLFTFYIVSKIEIGQNLGQKKHIHQEIIEACKQGDDKARYQLYQLYAKAMFNVSFRIMRNREEAEDMLQEAFTLAFQKLDSYRFESGFGSWIKKIVVNTCLNTINKRKIELVYCDEIYQNETVQEEEPELKFSTQNVLKAMEYLPDGGRMVFSLYLLEGYDHVEIAQIMGITESTSKSQFMRAKRRIVELLQTQNIWS
jgi:RNA polymerase sigma-70 factor (ECF subfamily)